MPGRSRSAAAALDGVEHPLHLQPVGERRRRVLVLGDGGDQVDDLVGEAVLVAEPVAGRPPGGDVGVLGLGDDDPAEAGGRGRVVAVEEVQDVHVLEVEREAAAPSR